MVADAVPPEAEALLTEGREMAHVATCAGNRPHVALVWYYYENETVEFVTGGHKLENIRENPRVAVSVEKSEDGRGEWHVVLFGTAETTTDEEGL